MTDAAAARAPVSSVAAPSALDDWATVWAAWIDRAPRAWAAALAFVALVAVHLDAPQSPLLVAAAAVVGARWLSPLRGTRWRAGLIVLVVALLLPSLLQGESPQADEGALRWCAAAAGADASALALGRGAAAGPWMFAASVGVVAAAVMLQDTQARVFAVAAAGPVAVVAGRARPVWALASAAVLTSVTMWKFGSGNPYGVLYWWLHDVGTALAVVVLARGVGLSPSATEADAASTRLVLRLHRHPWAAAALALGISRVLQPALSTTWSLAYAGGGGWCHLPWIGAAAAGVGLQAVAERTAWASARLLVVGALVPLAWGAASSVLSAGASGFGAADVVRDTLLAWGTLAFAWLVAGRGTVVASRPVLAWMTVAALVSIATALPLALEDATWYPQTALWTVVLLAAATSGSLPRTFAGWIAANVAVAAAGMLGFVAYVDEIQPVQARSHALADMTLGLAAGVVTNAVHGLMAVAALRRIWSLRAVPEEHVLRRDFAVDRRVAAP